MSNPRVRGPAAAGALFALLPLGLVFTLTGCNDEEAAARDTAPTAQPAIEAQGPSSFAPPATPYASLLRAAGGHLASARDRALVELDAAGAQANSEARAALFATSGVLRRGAARHLARHGGADEADALLEVLASGKGGDALRADVIAALGHVATDACIAALADLIERPSDREAFLAARQLAACDAGLPRERLRSLAGMGNESHARAASLLALGTSVLPEEGDLFRAGAMDYAPPIRMCAVPGLARLPDVTREEMEALVGDEDGGVRLAALRALPECDADWVAAVARGALGDRYDEHRVAACDAIAARPDPNSYEVLLAVLTNEKQDAHVRGAAARGLLGIDPARGVGAVEAVASQQSGSARLYCRDALEKLPHDNP